MFADTPTGQVFQVSTRPAAMAPAYADHFISHCRISDCRKSKQLADNIVGSGRNYAQAYWEIKYIRTYYDEAIGQPKNGIPLSSSTHVLPSGSPMTQQILPQSIVSLTCCFLLILGMLLNWKPIGYIMSRIHIPDPAHNDKFTKMQLQYDIRDLIETPFKVPFSIISCITLTLHKCIECTETVRITITELQRLQSIIHQNSNKIPGFWLLKSKVGCAIQPFYHHPTAERNHLTYDPRSLSIGTAWIEKSGLLEQTHCCVYGYHLVVVWEVDINRAVERESRRRRVEGSVSLCVVTDWSLG
jgi:hypothetical protein